MDEITRLISSYQRDSLLDMLVELEAEGSYMPTIGPVKAGLLYIITVITAPRRILELGTLHGYSSLVMLKACKDAGLEPVLITVERSGARARRAVENFRRAEVLGLVKVVVGEATSYLRSVRGEFDMAFIDIEKRLYPEAYELCLEVLRRGGVMIFDNALMPGLEGFLESALADRRVVSSLVKVGDGMLICVKR